MKLSEFELDVMQLFWRNDECSAPEVHEAVRRTRSVAYTTVKTVIDRLERKGVLKRIRQNGRTIFYSAAISVDVVQQSMLKRFVAHVFAGDRRPMMNYLLRDEVLSTEEIRYLDDLLTAQRQQHDQSAGEEE
ncbi:MAG: BlaI/MecI/CopY family transcriptional regulator [Gammaproteobacteria bacterium]|nr:BlaI/MecI/CopY family transcriptional regulator [Gammaproteobacteria bacterium]